MSDVSGKYTKLSFGSDFIPYLSLGLIAAPQTPGYIWGRK